MPLSTRFLFILPVASLVAACTPAGMAPAPDAPAAAVGVTGQPAPGGVAVAPATTAPATPAPAVDAAVPSVGGRATFQGQPLADAAVDLFAAGAAAPFASTRTGTDGAFRVALATLPKDGMVRVLATGTQATLAGVALVSTGSGNIVSAGGSNYALAGLLDGLVLDEAGTVAYVALGARLEALAAGTLTAAQAEAVVAAFDALRAVVAQAPAGALAPYAPEISAAVAGGTLPDPVAKLIVGQVPGFDGAFKAAATRLGDILAAIAPDRDPPPATFGGVRAAGYGGPSHGGGSSSDEPTETPPPAITGQIL